MIKSKAIFLKELVETPTLANNTMAFVFAANPEIDISSREAFYTKVINQYNLYKKSKPTIDKSVPDEVSIEAWSKKDLRIKSIKLSSIRGFPESQKPYGIDFRNEKGDPESMIILGGNAAGKSSIYDALEYCYCNSIGEALLRAYKQGANDQVKFKDFLRHLDNPESSTYCMIETVTDQFNIQMENIPDLIRRRINPNTHFISDYDIYTKGQLNYDGSSERSFHNTIAESLGLKELLQFEKYLKTFSLYRRQTESRNISALKRSSENQQKLIENNETAIKERTLRLDQLKTSQVRQPQEENTKRLLEKLQQAKSVNMPVSFSLPQLIKSVDDFIGIYSEFLSKEIKNIGINEIQFLTLGLELLKDHDNCPFCNSSKLLKEEIASSTKQRIDRIQDVNKSIQNINKAFNVTIDALTNLRNQIDLIKGRIAGEFSILQADVEFNDLTILENRFLADISDLISHTFLIEVAELTENPNFLKNKNKFLFEFLSKNREYIGKELITRISNISDFQAGRASFFKKIEQELTSKIQTTLVTEQIIGLNKDISDFQSQIKIAKKSIEDDSKRIDELLELQVSFDQVKEETIGYLKVFHNALNKEVEKAFAPIKLIVEEVLESYFKADKREVDLVISKQPEEIDEETGEVLSEIITAKIIHKMQNVSPQPVGKYLNTFHYRLFSTMVGISVAIASRISTGINLPLVLDDIFYASDFENRSTIEEFLREIFNSFEKYTPDLPLQLILFTHDQLIFESAIKVTKENGEGNIAFAKLFPYKEAKSEVAYFNLIYKFPEYSPRKVMKSLLPKV